MRPDQLRREFPVFERVAYLNSGTFGPMPAASMRAAADVGLRAAEDGRAGAYYDKREELATSLRARYARIVRGETDDVAVVASTSDGIVRVLSALQLRKGDVVLTALGEHPGLLAPLAQLRRLHDVEIRTAPLTRIHEAVDSDVTLVACSHVSWVDGSTAPTELTEVGREIPVLLDGAQGAGAIDVDVQALGCAAYSAAGQKWLCGPMGTGLLWIAPRWRERLAPTGPIAFNLQPGFYGLEALAQPGGVGFDSGSQSAETLAAADAATGLLGDAGFSEVAGRATGLAETLAGMLRDAGRTVAPRGQTTLVSFEDDDPATTVARLADAGVIVRDLPGTAYVRASVGAYNDQSDLQRLVTNLG